MKKLNSNLDFIVNISARKIQYFEYIKNKSPEFNKYQEAIKDIVANMDNSVFISTYEIEIKDFQEKINLDGHRIKANFEYTFEKMYPQLFNDFFKSNKMRLKKI